MKKKGKKPMYTQINNLTKEQQQTVEMLLEQIENQDTIPQRNLLRLKCNAKMEQKRIKLL